jgi:hypothetical protein
MRCDVLIVIFVTLGELYGHSRMNDEIRAILVRSREGHRNGGEVETGVGVSRR